MSLYMATSNRTKSFLGSSSFPQRLFCAPLSIYSGLQPLVEEILRPSQPIRPEQYPLTNASYPAGEEARNWPSDTASVTPCPSLHVQIWSLGREVHEQLQPYIHSLSSFLASIPLPSTLHWSSVKREAAFESLTYAFTLARNPESPFNG